jgi:hypothetical protein
MKDCRQLTSSFPACIAAHVELFDKSVADRVKDENNGDYEKLLLEVIGCPDE